MIALRVKGNDAARGLEADLPKALAVPHTKANLASLERRRGAIEQRRTAKRTEALGLKERLEAEELKFAMPAGENGKLFGSEVTMIPAYRWGWSYISHFVHARFYCFSYVFGELLVLALYRRYQQEGPAFAPRYLELLRAGGSAAPDELLRPLGIDLNDPEFWAQGYAVVREMLEELGGLIAKGQAVKNA